MERWISLCRWGAI